MDYYSEYESDWYSFKLYIEDKVRDRCDLTNKNWLRLREYHLDGFLKKHKSPYGFLFKVKFFHPEKYRGIHCMPHYYGLYKELRNQTFNETEQ